LGPDSLYKACDIRGHAEEELTEALYEHWGRVLAARVEVGAPFAVGGDVRPSTPAFLEALCAGLAAGGAQVVEVGVAPTPMVYFGRRHLQTRACAIVTASHNPPHVNGLKWMVGSRPPDEAEVRSLSCPPGGATPPGRAGGGRSAADLSAPYGAWLTERWAHDAALRLVVDPGNGCWSGRAGEYLRAVFPAAEVTALHDRADGTFPERSPDCSRPGPLAELAAVVRERGAGVGIAFDGDGDRVAFVDDEGAVLSAEEATQVLLGCLGAELAGRGFVHDVKFSDKVADAARALGAEPRAQRSGHAFIRRLMMDCDARFGAEISGHYFDAELEGGDDGLFTACRLVHHLGREGARLSDLRRACAPVFMTPDLRLEVPAAEQEAVLAAVRAAHAGRPQSDVDGVRVDFPRGWALVRRSVTEPAVTCRFEGRRAADLEDTIEAFCSTLPELGPRLAELYRREREGETT